MRTTASALVAALVVWFGTSIGAAVKVRTQFDKNFNFTAARTWAWNDRGAGEVKMARTADDDPEAVRQRYEPTVKDAVATELPGRGLTAAVAGAAPDLEVTYYVLVTVGTQSQQIGQFLPAVSEWGLPPFSGPTQSYKVIEQGSLVLDISANDRVIWRGIGQAELKLDSPAAKRHARLREAVRDILKRYPPKP